MTSGARKSKEQDLDRLPFSSYEYKALVLRSGCIFLRFTTAHDCTIFESRPAHARLIRITSNMAWMRLTKAIACRLSALVSPETPIQKEPSSPQNPENGLQSYKYDMRQGVNPNCHTKEAAGNETRQGISEDWHKPQRIRGPNQPAVRSVARDSAQPAPWSRRRRRSWLQGSGL